MSKKNESANSSCEIKSHSLNNDKNSNEWFPTLEEYNPGLSVEAWIELLQDNDVFTESSIKIIERLIDCGGQATCKELSGKYGESSNFYNRGISSLAERVYKKTNCPLPPKENGAYWWPIVCFQKKNINKSQGTWLIKFRAELKTAYEIIYCSAPDNVPYTKEDFLNQVYMTEQNYNRLRSLLKNKKNIILQGAPGVGKTFSAKRLAYSVMGEIDDYRIEFVQFHQSYSYEDFIMGYRPNETGGFELKRGIFYLFCQKAKQDLSRDYFFIIDEINRGNLSKIFGELLMLIEKDYRNEKATLAYTGEKFAVPQNIYIIGMMNTADRSLAMIDYALRRRFSFFEMEPGFTSVGFKTYSDELNNETFNALIEQIKFLNNDIEKDNSLGKGFRIGHSYFCNLKKDEFIFDRLCSIVDYDILPILNEYWFDDEKKIIDWKNKLYKTLGVSDDE